MALGITGQRVGKAVQYRVVACATAPVAPATDFTDKKSLINQIEMSGKQVGAFAIRKASNGELNVMIATGDLSTSVWIPLTRASTITPAAVAALNLSTDLAATQSVAPAADATFAIVAAGGHAPYTYQWYWNGVLIDTTLNPSADTATLVNHAVTTASAGKYWCVVTDLDGKTIKSTECTLTVA